MNDPNWNNGDYYSRPQPQHGQAVARMIGHVTYLSDIALHKKFDQSGKGGTGRESGFFTEFPVSNYLRHQGQKFVHRFDANSLLYLTRASDAFNLAQSYGDGSLVQAFSRAQCKYLVLSFSSDWLYPTSQSRSMVKAMKKNNIMVTFCEIDIDYGHDSFLVHNPKQAALVSGFLDQVHREGG
jgi:homoserine O-acetyltransferase